MEFDFLPRLPKSDLDDRTFKELVEECILRIPRYCPEWTNHNPSDPGITLVELFAWLTDQMLLRFNQVPRRQYVAFLELLGIRLQAPTPAHTEVAFYLTRPQRAENLFPAIPQGTEVATERSETDEAIVFSTEQPLEIGIPTIRHFLTAEACEERPQMLRDRLSGLWRQEASGEWSGQRQPVFSEQPQPGNCFYLAFEPDEPLNGNVIRLTITGEPAGSTGIDPERPPRHWEAWNGTYWQPILLSESDDGTRGFSFDEAGEPTAQAIREAEVTLHLPLNWPDTAFSTYRGRWLRCVYSHPQQYQAAYSHPPRFTALSAIAIGGITTASQCTIVQDELLGESDGKPGQILMLQSDSILPRDATRYPQEHLIVTPPGSLPQIWEEVENFAESGPEDRHYTLDSTTGRLQLGPLIRESGQLREATAFRQRIQRQAGGVVTQTDIDSLRALERQYGAIPPRGSTLRMARYRTGGGTRGNVQPKTIRILKSAIPYVTRVTNYLPARDGADAESLDDAVIRVPSFLRTQERAVTPEDFETLALASSRAVARAYCPTQRQHQPKAGVVRLLVVPRVMTSAQNGLSPDQLRLSSTLESEIQQFLDERRLLGIEVELQAPKYVGVSVQAEVVIEPEYRSDQAQQQIRQQLETQLYSFLNPVEGGLQKTGWEFGRPVRLADIAPLFRQVQGVSYVQTLQLFELAASTGERQAWERKLAHSGVVNPGPLGLICSWNNSQSDGQIRSAHDISLLV